jgi:hypothetical protein
MNARYQFSIQQLVRVLSGSRQLRSFHNVNNKVFQNLLGYLLLEYALHKSYDE